jgi:hypothetical protein
MNHLSTLTMHQVRLGEIEGEARAEAEAHLRECVECSDIVQRQADEDAALGANPLPEWLLSLEAPSPMPKDAHRPTPPEPPVAPANRPFPRWIVALVTAAAATLALGVGFEMAPQTGITPVQTEGARPKGGLPEMELWVKSNAGPRPIRKDEAVRAGDTVQVFYDTNGASHAALAGRDGTGKIEVYGVLPKHDTLGPAPFSLTLDDAPGPQEFFVVTGARPLSTEDVKRAVDGKDRSVQVRSVKVPKS